MEERETKMNEEKLVALINPDSLEEFLKLYRESLNSLKVYDHVELLLRACRFGLLPFVRNILNDGSAMINANCRHPSSGITPLVVAIRAQKHDVINFLIQEASADVNWSSEKTKTTCLHEAIRQHDSSTTRLLLQHGATVSYHHLQTVMIECLKANDTASCSTILFDTLVNHRPEILDDSGRKRATDFIIRRTRGSSSHSYHLLASLLERLLPNGNCQSLMHSLVSSSIKASPVTSQTIHRTQVAIIGAGPAGLVLGALLSQSGIDSIVIEVHSRSHVESNIRAGVLEQSTTDLLDDIGAGERLFQNGIIQRNINIQFDGERLTLPVRAMTQGKAATIYGQHVVLQDLIDLRIKSGQRLWFDIKSVCIERNDVIDDDSGPCLRFTRSDCTDEELILCDFIAGCEGASGQSCRRSIPDGVLRTIERTYPFSWLSILVQAPPNGNEIIYSVDNNNHGFALHSLRSLAFTRFHLQVPLGDTLADWPDERIWNELQLRLQTKHNPCALNKGPIVERALFPLRSAVTMPMQYKRVFLAGDAAHIMPPTGAKGLNVALKDAQMLAQAFEDYYDNDEWHKINNYTTDCLPHIWQAQEFANYMTSLLHKIDLSSDCESNHDSLLQFTQQQSLRNSKALQQHFAEMFVH